MMPIHYIESERLADKIRELEQAGEQVASVVAEGDNFQVFTLPASRRAPGNIEKRADR
jgi:hypothetical protein